MTLDCGEIFVHVEAEWEVRNTLTDEVVCVGVDGSLIKSFTCMQTLHTITGNKRPMQGFAWLRGRLRFGCLDTDGTVSGTRLFRLEMVKDPSMVLSIFASVLRGRSLPFNPRQTVKTATKKDV